MVSMLFLSKLSTSSEFFSLCRASNGSELNWLLFKELRKRVHVRREGGKQLVLCSLYLQMLDVGVGEGLGVDLGDAVAVQQAVTEGRRRHSKIYFPIIMI